MKITRKSLFSGIERTMDLDITQEQLAKWESGELLIQHAFPHLTADEREFLMTGATPDEWDNAFGDDDDSEQESPVT